MSTDCENLLKKFLVLNPAKRASLETIMKDKWMNQGYVGLVISFIHLVLYVVGGGLMLIDNFFNFTFFLYNFGITVESLKFFNVKMLLMLCIECYMGS